MIVFTHLFKQDVLYIGKKQKTRSQVSQVFFLLKTPERRNPFFRSPSSVPGTRVLRLLRLFRVVRLGKVTRFASFLRDKFESEVGETKRKSERLERVKRKIRKRKRRVRFHFGKKPGSAGGGVFSDSCSIKQTSRRLGVLLAPRSPTPNSVCCCWWWA